MSKREDQDSIARWLMRPLCRSYAAVTVRNTRVRRAGFRGALDEHIQWGLGSVPGGEFEVLGAWTERGRGATVSPILLLDLEERGVRSIGALIGGAADAADQPVSAGAMNGVAVIAAQGLALRESKALNGRRTATRRAAFALDELAEDLNRRLRAAVNRRGVFVDDGEALSFVAAFLQRADLGLGQPPQWLGFSLLRSAAMPAPAVSAVRRG
ncbi:hypothetical protein ACFJGW_15425 [Burkholderiaceae bacterium UC74_6]